MTIEDLINYLNTLDKDLIVYLGDSTYPTEELTDNNITVTDNGIVIY